MPAAKSSLDARVLAVLRAGGLLTAAQIGEALGVDRMPVRGALIRLRQRGLARVAGMGLAHGERSARALTGAPGIWEAVAAAPEEAAIPGGPRPHRPAVGR